MTAINPTEETYFSLLYFLQDRFDALDLCVLRCLRISRDLRLRKGEKLQTTSPSDLEYTTSLVVSPKQDIFCTRLCNNARYSSCTEES